MAVSTHYKVMYSDAVIELAGSQSRSLLKELVGYESKQGEIVFLDGIGPDDDANTTAIASTNTREAYEGINSPDLADWLDLMTPHMAIDKQRTHATPNCIDWGHHFNKERKLRELGDPKSKTLKQAMKRIWKAEDNLILTALSASTVTRGKDAANTSSVSFPAGQKLTIDTGAGADGTEDLTEIDEQIFGRVRELFEDQYAEDEPIYLVMSPQTKRILVNNGRDKIQSRDFVTKTGYLESGELPDVDGVHPLVHPLVGNSAMYAWSPMGVTWNQFDALETNLDRSPEQRFHYVAYMEQYADCKRVDDNRVVQITIQATAAS